MTLIAQKRWTMLSLLGMLYWLFGNLYEAIVISPNWVVNSPEQMQRLHDFFVNTSPTHYFVPITQLATVIIWVLFFRNRIEFIKRDLKMASIFGVLVTGVNFFIVSTIVLKLFAPDFLTYDLSALTWRWNVLNVLRMGLTATTVYYVFNVYRKLDKIS